ncbi:MAG: hypothetical protein KF797_13690 [Flavobacteriales bacterium]|nr:hypothetical protein [Flavobacteriales bacterium]
MSLIDRRHAPRDRACIALRLFVGCLCVWLFMAPQVSYSAAVIAFCDEYGCTTLPLIEEEEVCHSAIPPRAMPTDAHASPEADEVALPHWEELLLHTLHGEVPHPPPWA